MATKKAKKPVKKAAPKKQVKKPAAKKASPKKKVAKPAKKAASKKTSKPANAVKKLTPTKKAVKSVQKKAVKKVTATKGSVSQKAIPAVKPVGKVVVPKPMKSNDKRGRYSDEELRMFRNLIVKKLEESRHEFKYYQEQIANSNESSDTSDTKIMTMEDGSASNEREYISQMMSRKIQHINNLEKALMRIVNKTYGICRITGKLISKERLLIVPHATTSMEGKMLEQK